MDILHVADITGMFAMRNDETAKTVHSALHDAISSKRELVVDFDGVRNVWPEWLWEAIGRLCFENDPADIRRYLSFVNIPFPLDVLPHFFRDRDKAREDVAPDDMLRHLRVNIRVEGVWIGGEFIPKPIQIVK